MIDGLRRYHKDNVKLMFLNDSVLRNFITKYNLVTGLLNKEIKTNFEFKIYIKKERNLCLKRSL